MEYYSAVNRNEAATETGLKGNMLHEKCQPQKMTHYTLNLLTQHSWNDRIPDGEPISHCPGVAGREGAGSVSWPWRAHTNLHVWYHGPKPHIQVCTNACASNWANVSEFGTTSGLCPCWFPGVMLSGSQATKHPVPWGEPGEGYVGLLWFLISAH